MTGILILENVEQSYCDQCGRACIVGVFKVFNWNHTFRVCDNCLREIANNIVHRRE